jgi:predicted RNA polymerase sigma factor
VVFVGDYTHLETRDPTPHSSDDTDGFDNLVEWVRRHGCIREDAARLVVLTRAAGVSVAELASTHNVDPQTLRQRRLRAERRIRHGLSLASGISDTGTRLSASHTLPTGRTTR